MKESSPTSRVTHASKRKLQTHQEIEDFPRGRPNDKITKGRGKKLKIHKEIDVQIDPNIKEEPDELEYYTTHSKYQPSRRNILL